jgi:alpha-N-acetylglucosamine transferase
MNRTDIKKLTLESYHKIESYMKNLDKEAKGLDDKYLIKPNFRVYKSKLYNNPHKKYAYVTSVFINESYIPSALVLGKNIKLLKHKYPSVCMIQDKSYKVLKGDQYEYFQGVSEKAISDLLELYDYVIGVDLLKVHNYAPSPYHFTNNVNYSNILYYVTKGQVLGLTMFEKVMYLDASSYLENNIDNVFSTFSKSTFLGDREFQDTKVGIHGAFFLVTPNKYFYHKHRNFVEDYQKYFSDLYFIRGVDELLIFFSVFPEWSNLHFDSHFACRKNKMRSFQDCDIYHFQFTKPFRKDEKEVDLGENIKRHYTYYDDWDKIVKLLLKSHPHLEFYFKHIKGFRETQF